MRTFSLALLTFNRCEVVKKSLSHNLMSAGRPVDEIVWCDNGSTDGLRDVIANEVKPDIAILHDENLGVSKGYNRAMLLSSGTHILITGCDRLMPNGWLKAFEKALELKPRAHAISMYSQPLDKFPERIRGEKGIETYEGMRFQKAMPFGARVISRELFLASGLLLENLGLYGHEDCAWSERAMKVCEERGWEYYALPDYIPEHLGDEGNNGWAGKDSKEYHEFKMREVRDPMKKIVLQLYGNAGFPYYNPYVGEDLKKLFGEKNAIKR